MTGWGELGLFLAAGAALGVAYLYLLRRSVDGLVAGGAALPALLLGVARLGAAVAAFWLAAQYGAGPLLAMLAGFTLARFAVLRLKAE